MTIRATAEREFDTFLDMEGTRPQAARVRALHVKPWNSPLGDLVGVARYLGRPQANIEMWFDKGCLCAMLTARQTRNFRAWLARRLRGEKTGFYAPLVTNRQNLVFALEWAPKRTVVPIETFDRVNWQGLWGVLFGGGKGVEIPLASTAPPQEPEVNFILFEDL